MSLDFEDVDEPVASQHYAFLISEDEFDTSFAKIKERGLTYWATPWLDGEMEINHNDGGRGCYFRDPSGHFMEIITRPYGSGSA